MAKKELQVLVAEQKILNKIYVFRGEKVMLDNDLAEMYGVETKQLKRQVRRNKSRFPKDFMFELSTKEFENLRSQIGTSSWGGTRYNPMAFKFSPSQTKLLKISTPINPVMDTIVSIIVHVRNVCLIVKLKYSLNNQKPPSFTCENIRLPAPMDSTISSGRIC